MGFSASVADAHVRMSLQLQQQFGLRREECIKFQPSYADHGDRIELKGSWTKGGRSRDIPITTAEQRAALDAGHRLVGAGSLIPAHKTYIQQRHTYDGQCKAAGLANMHGLRHLYAQTRYEALTGWKAPAAGGPIARMLTAAQRAQDAVARQTISHELGHERSQITVRYRMRKTTWLRLLVPIVVVALVPAAITRAQETTKSSTPRLSAEQVSSLAAAAFAKSDKSVGHFKGGKPQFSEATGIWSVFYIQSKPPYVVDGDTVVVVNDRTRGTCVQQAMAPPRPCN